jgi:Xaa-Pro aminopeptidase
MRITPVASDRLARVRQMFPEWTIDALYVTHAANRRWLSGFNGSAGQLLVTRDQAILSTDFRYWEAAQVQAPGFELHRHSRRDGEIARLIAGTGSTRIGLEARHVSLSEFKLLNSIQGISWISLDASLELFRKVKDDSEIEAIRAAAAIADRAMGLVNSLARPGISELALAWELEKRIRDRDGARMAFPIIVASGPNSALPHHQSGQRLLQSGDALIVDMGAEVNGYKSDLTRSFYMGEDPAGEYWRIYDLVLTAHSTALEGARPGISARQLDALGRDLIEGAGYGQAFGHGLGHGIGLEVHEDPFLSQRPQAETEILSTGNVITIEPGIYLPGWGGVRVEDLLLFGPTGAESLSQCPKTPLIPLS